MLRDAYAKMHDLQSVIDFQVLALKNFISGSSSVDYFKSLDFSSLTLLNQKILVCIHRVLEYKLALLTENKKKACYVYQLLTEDQNIRISGVLDELKDARLILNMALDVIDSPNISLEDCLVLEDKKKHINSLLSSLSTQESVIALVAKEFVALHNK